MRFFKRKSKAIQSSTETISSPPSKSPSVTPRDDPSKSSKSSKSTESTTRSISTKSTAEATIIESIDDRQDAIEFPSLNLDTESHRQREEDICYLSTITTSSSDTETDLSSNGHVIATEISRTMRQYIVDHLLECVDFIQEDSLSDSHDGQLCGILCVCEDMCGGDEDDMSQLNEANVSGEENTMPFQ